MSVDDAAGDPELDAALNRFWDLAQRYLPAGDLDLQTYRRDLKQRFANGRIAYPLAQIAGDGVGSCVTGWFRSCKPRSQRATRRSLRCA